MKRNNKLKFKKVIVDMDARFKSITQYLLMVVLVVILSVAGGQHFSIIGVAGNVDEIVETEQSLTINSVEKIALTSTTQVVAQTLSSRMIESNLSISSEISTEEVVETNVVILNEESEIVETKEVGPGIELEEEIIEETEPIIETEPEITYILNLSDNERAILERIVEAEVTGDENSFRNVSRQEVYESKIRVAQVVIERVLSPQFPNSVEGVVFQKRQFSPIGDKRYWKVSVCDLTREAVEAALRTDTPKYSQGALFFTRGKKCGAKASPIFTDPVGHTFFK